MKEGQPNPLSPLERTAFGAYQLIMSSQIGSHRLEVPDLIDPNSRQWRKIVGREININAQGTLYLPEVSHKYDNYTTIVGGDENLPPEGPLVILLNHYDRGPDKGIWTDTIVPRVIADRTAWGWKRRYRFMIKNSFIVEPKPTDGPIKTAVKKTIKPYVEPIASHILENFGEASDSIAVESENSAQQIADTIKNGGVLFSYHAGIDEYELGETLEKIPVLAKVGIRYGATVLPVGTFHSGRNLAVNIGKPITLDDLKGLDKKAQAEQIGIAIARLLPSQMHGAYAGRV